MNRLIKDAGEKGPQQRFPLPGDAARPRTVISFLLNGFQHIREQGRRILKVHIHDGGIIPCGRFQARIDGGFLPEIAGEGNEFYFRGVFRHFLNHFQGAVRGTVVHEDKFRGVALQAFLEDPVYFLLERRNGFFFIQAGNDQGNAFHVSAQIILQKPCGCQKIVPPCTKPSSTGRGGRLPEKKPCTEKYR